MSQMGGCDRENSERNIVNELLTNRVEAPFAFQDAYIPKERLIVEGRLRHKYRLTDCVPVRRNRLASWTWDRRPEDLESIV